MLAAIISLLADVQPQPPKPLPTIKIDRGGGGMRYPAFQIVDYVAAAATFPEIAGEDSVARAKRRAEHIARELERIQREKHGQEQAFALGLLWGAALQAQVQAAQEVELAALRAAQAERETATVLASTSRGAGFSLAPIAVIAGVAATAALTAYIVKRALT